MKSKLVFLGSLVVFFTFSITASASENVKDSYKRYSHPSQCLADSGFKNGATESNYFVIGGSCYDARHFCMEGELVVTRGGLDRSGKKTCLASPHAMGTNLYWQ